MERFSNGVHYELTVNGVGAMCAGKCVIEAGHILEPHKHDNDEIYIITDGYGFVTIDGNMHTVIPGDTLFIPANSVHSIESFATEKVCFSFIFKGMDWNDIEYEWEAVK